ncbi:MAG: putative Nitrogen assimilation transcription regulatory protein (ntrC)(synonyms:glnT, glnG), partial [candidate division NC10 bacterium]|nr:putative Nitrogen assimilation transcription regulatory protein (ntrC)(synonyms:glnT, glnG) [candidate division NC10 bacterium]
ARMAETVMGPKKILVVDDEESIRWALRKALEREGYRVVLASDGAEALARATESGIDLVLMDIKMPGSDGFETLKPSGHHHDSLWHTAGGGSGDEARGVRPYHEAVRLR